MLLKECYDAFGGSYESVKERISKDEIIEKFVKKFLTDQSYSNLCQAVEEENYEEAFKAAHSLKGVCANLGFVNLTASVSELTELLRNSSSKVIDKDECIALFKQVSEDYSQVKESIRKYADS